MYQQLTLWTLESARCTRCGRELSNPTSIKEHQGPVCRGKMNRSDNMETPDFADKSLNFDPAEHGFILRRDEAGQTFTNVPHLVVHHSPDGFEWGYGGSGPADLALNICELMLKKLGHHGETTKCFDGACFTLAWRMHQTFNRDFIALADRDNALIPYQEVEAWVRAYIGMIGERL